LAGRGELLGDVLVPQGKIGIATVCSIVINGFLLKNGIPMDSKFGGILQINRVSLYDSWSWFIIPVHPSNPSECLSGENDLGDEGSGGERKIIGRISGKFPHQVLALLKSSCRIFRRPISMVFSLSATWARPSVRRPSIQ